MPTQPPTRRGARKHHTCPICTPREPGWWWLATTGRHLGFESWLEHDHLMLLDFDPAVTAVWL
jgi:hypothetical protein